MEFTFQVAIRTAPTLAALGDHAASPGERAPEPAPRQRQHVYTLAGGVDHPVVPEVDPLVDDVALGGLAVEVRRSEEQQIAGLELAHAQPLGRGDFAGLFGGCAAANRLAP